MNAKLLIVSLITLVRVPAALVSSFSLLNQEWQWAWAMFILCVATDVVDGRLARQWNVVSKFGTTADLVSDIAIFWVFVPAAYWYSQLYSPWWQKNYPPLMMAINILAIAVAVIIWVVSTPIGRRLLSWYRAKGNFWCGVIPVACIGGWMAWEASVWSLVITVVYGVSALWLNRSKVSQFI